MQFIPVKTRILQPPKDDLLAVLDVSLTDLQAGDVLVVSSKVLAIHEGRCVPGGEYDVAAHIAREADVVIPRPDRPSPLTLINHTIVGGAGVDRSNSNGYVTLLPRDPFLSARRIYEYTTKRFGTTELGVIITDSHSVPCRYGAQGVAIGWWGFQPLVDHVNKADLFGRKIQYERSNLADGVAAGAVVVMGEVAECTPLVIARNVPNLLFTTENTKDKLFCPPEDDIMKVLYKDFLT
ncbi:coenzyme F420-0:L-glutamate ligase [Candidatus Kaiserbacteria bacterium]|nr:coenzyme F420-0:L-glutamate ligase [Candidatus Kaiserbacteria bacterium]MCB9812495.1 coenzyme F420-0:L-glutamate ligase [Candidatus Nomurabacteria bacterium]